MNYIQTINNNDNNDNNDNNNNDKIIFKKIY